MVEKDLIRKKYFLKRKKKYFQVKENFFIPLVKLIKHRIKDSKIYMGLYFPSSFELNVLKILNVEYFKKSKFLLPAIEENNSMNFYKWKSNDLLFLNKYGIPEPDKSKKIIPSVILVPILAYDKKKNRLGYGKGFYDKYFHKLKKLNKKMLIVGVAFSFQKYNNLPVNSRDFKLDHIITEKGII